jgi:hypothetical protein
VWGAGRGRSERTYGPNGGGSRSSSVSAREWWREVPVGDRASTGRASVSVHRVVVWHAGAVGVSGERQCACVPAARFQSCLHQAHHPDEPQAPLHKTKNTNVDMPTCELEIDSKVGKGESHRICCNASTDGQCTDR